MFMLRPLFSINVCSSISSDSYFWKPFKQISNSGRIFALYLYFGKCTLSHGSLQRRPLPYKRIYARQSILSDWAHGDHFPISLSKPDLIIRLRIIISNQLGVSLFFCLNCFRCKFKKSWIFLIESTLNSLIRKDYIVIIVSPNCGNLRHWEDSH